MYYMFRSFYYSQFAKNIIMKEHKKRKNICFIVFIQQNMREPAGSILLLSPPPVHPYSLFFFPFSLFASSFFLSPFTLSALSNKYKYMYLYCIQSQFYKMFLSYETVYLHQNFVIILQFQCTKHLRKKYANQPIVAQHLQKSRK